MTPTITLFSRQSCLKDYIGQAPLKRGEKQEE